MVAYFIWFKFSSIRYENLIICEVFIRLRLLEGEGLR